MSVSGGEWERVTGFYIWGEILQRVSRKGFVDCGGKNGFLVGIFGIRGKRRGDG